LFHILIDNDALFEFIADKFVAGCTIIQSFFKHARSHWATLVDQPRRIIHTPVTQDILRLDAEAKILEPPIAQFLLVQRIIYNIRPICQAQVTTVTAPGKIGSMRQPLPFCGFDR
jgi:hypothetical protein